MSPGQRSSAQSPWGPFPPPTHAQHSAGAWQGCPEWPLQIQIHPPLRVWQAGSGDKPAWKGLWLGASILARFGVSAPPTFCLTRQHSHLLAGIAASSWFFGRGIHWVCTGLAFTLLRVEGEHCGFTVPPGIPAPRKPGHLSPSWLCSVLHRGHS